MGEYTSRKYTFDLFYNFQECYSYIETQIIQIC